MTDTQLQTFQSHTMANGLVLLMAVNKLSPRIYTHIVVKAGAKNDPPGLAGLAHYMEHMLFKGSDKIGTLDWEKESALLGQISELFEKHRHSSDPEEKKSIYTEIDRLSYEAAQLVASNEYDKLLSAIGAKQTNAYTGYDQTVYINDIPSNELERWMQLESERFSYMALRLFHTELETVYEEFNMSQVNDHRKATAGLRTLLFPGHPYGTQTVIGPAEQLKNPSQQKIREFFKQYYRPNNMAIIMSGDFDPAVVIKLAEKYFGHFSAGTIPEGPQKPNHELPVNQSLEVFGEESPFVYLAWKFPGDPVNALRWLPLLDSILQNEETGLLDINLNKQQKVLQANAWTWGFTDYNTLGLFGMPKGGQTLEEVKDLLLDQMAALRRGEFEDWLPEAVTKNFKLQQQTVLPSNQGSVQVLTSYFLQGYNWEDYLSTVDWLEQISKADIVAFAQRHLGEPHAIVYKRTGEDHGIVRVSQPPITPVPIQNDRYSDFGKAFLAQEESRMNPVFVNFEAHIQGEILDSEISFKLVQNPVNDIFSLEFVFELGKKHDPKLQLAGRYLEYLGTQKMSATRIAQEFFKLGLGFDLQVDAERSSVTLYGLEESLEQGLELLQQVLFELKPDRKTWENLVSDILTRRQNNKQDRTAILKHALPSYAKYGSFSPFSNVVPEAELAGMDPSGLTDKIRDLFEYPFQVLYYGKRPVAQFRKYLQPFLARAGRKPLPQMIHFPTASLHENELFFLDFPIVQNEILLLGKSTNQFDLEAFKAQGLYNNYFGMGLSSIVFQEIRESKGLAYSSYAYFNHPSKKEDPHYISAYVGTQPDKVRTAIPALTQILQNMPVHTDQIYQSRQSILKRIESERIAPEKIFSEYLATQALGYNYDLRTHIYDWLSAENISDRLEAFHRDYIRERPFRYMVMGDKKNTDMEYLKSLGNVREISLEEVFGY